jgi:3-hydroxyisobutyrate dehydrogenase-like beta-hydroxyacid dehydrogenase
MNVGFLGLGAMGVPMATRICQSFPTFVWNRTTRGLPGATVAKTPRECVQDADIVVTMLADAAALDAVLDGENGALAGWREGVVLVEMSTSGRRAALSIAERVQKRGGRFVDAPVSGTVGPAERGELLAFAGGAIEDIEKVRPVLDRMCRQVLHVGAIGQGQVMKVTLNGIGAHQLVAFTSMLALAERAGIPRAIAVEAYTQGAFATPSYIGKKAKVLARDWSPQFSLDLTRKDLELNLELQDDVGLVLPVTREIEKAIARGLEKGLGSKDLFALEEIFLEK